MTTPHTFSPHILHQVLEAFADAEDQGRALLSVEIQAIAGSNSCVPRRVREALAQAGLLAVLSEPRPGGAPAACKVTEAGWLRLGRRPKAGLVRDRMCLRCQQPFRSRNAGHRRCGPCSEAVKKAGASWEF